MIKTTELTVNCPDLHFQSDEIIVHETLAAAPGIGLVEVDHVTGMVHFITANQDGGQDVKNRLADAGYPPNPV